MFELFLSNGALFNETLPSTGGIGNNTGVYGGKFVIVSTTDFSQQGQTVVWRETIHSCSILILECLESRTSAVVLRSART
jgi:hypothetical protein